VPRGGEFDGVVQIATPNGLCTGSVLPSARHILTAAHCVDMQAPFGVPDGPVTVTFELVRDGVNYNIAIPVPANRITIHPGGDANAANGNDLAILRLTEQEPGFQLPNRHLVAPFSGENQRYALFTGANELTQNFTIVGYGETGTGDDGNHTDEVQ